MKKGISVMVVYLRCWWQCGRLRGKGKIAVAANDKIPGASVSDRAGLSPFFLLFDEKGN